MQNILLESTNEQYHADRTRLSSSNLKLLLKDPAKFYAEWVLGLKTEQHKPAFDEGSFVHSLILEPEKLGHYVVYPGLRKAGEAWEKFKAENVGKIILSAPQVNRCEQLYKSYAATDIATNILRNGVPEHTMLGSYLDVPIKTRADYINIDMSYIVDVKTTAAPTDKELFAHTVTEYGYDLSAALYCQMAYENYGKLFDFYWLVLSKSDQGCAVYKASSSTLSRGNSLVTSAIVLYKKCMATGLWTLEQTKPSIQIDVEEI